MPTRRNFIAALSAGARVSSAELTLIVTKANTGGLLCNLHRVLRSWAEGSEIGGGNGAPAVQGETTWLARFHPDTFWDAPGATNGIDFSSAPSATAVLGGAGSANVLTAPALAADVQAWLDQPASNFGWVLLASDETVVQTARRIGSRENTDAPPVLTVHFRVGPQLYGPALNTGFFSFWFDAASNQGYAVEYRSSLREGDWQPLTNIAPLSSPAALCIYDDACAESRFYRVHVE